MSRKSDSASRTVLLAGVAAIMPFTALSAASGPVQEPASFAPLQTRFVLTRTLHSPLADGNEIVTRRSYEVTIAPDGQDYRVEGTLIDCQVEAPPALAMMAELERNRPDTGMFPLHLDSRGLLRAPGARQDSENLKQVAGAIRQRIAISPPGGDTGSREEAGNFVRAVEGAKGGTSWPQDLFVSRIGRRVDRQVVALPDGGTGEVIVEIEVTRPASGETLFERKVTTQIGTSSRVMREEWSIVAKG